MHVILGLVGSILTALWPLHRQAERASIWVASIRGYGVAAAGWRQKYQANPVYSLQ